MGVQHTTTSSHMTGEPDVKEQTILELSEMTLATLSNLEQELDSVILRDADESKTGTKVRYSNVLDEIIDNIREANDRLGRFRDNLRLSVYNKIM